MKDAADLISAISALVAALAWPALLLALFVIFRRQIAEGAAKIPILIDRVQTVKIGTLEASLEKAGDAAVLNAQNNGAISEKDIQAAAKLSVETQLIDPNSIRIQLERLCVEYETTRSVMKAGNDRTMAMTRIFAKMRAISLSAVNFVDELKQSDSPGNRLTAIAIMQMDPRKADLKWLLERFTIEVPFIFFHASVSLQILAQAGISPDSADAKRVASEASKIVRAFDGYQDVSTLRVLDAIVD